MNTYHKNRWENQPYYSEVFIEKKALQGIFTQICEDWNIGLGACKGYPSLTFLNDTAERFYTMFDKNPVILYFGDYDPSGEDIPRSIEENLRRFGIVDIEVRRIALMESQVLEWNLPPAPTKLTDTRTAKWNGLGQVELDAVPPEKLIQLCENAILDVFYKDLHNDLIVQERKERKLYRQELKKYVNSLKD